MEAVLYQIAQAGFILLTLVCVSLLIREWIRAVRATTWEEKRQNRYIFSMIGSLVIWAAFVSFWSLSGFMQDFSRFPFNLLPVIAIPLAVAVVFIPSRATGEILNQIPPKNIVRLQSFRFIVEVLLWMLFVAGVLPKQMTFEGRNLDILAGFSAPVISVLIANRRISSMGVVIWNVICLCLLVNIVAIAILSTPSPLRVFTNEPANYIVTHFPFSWLPGFLVPLAYYLHFLSIRQMRRSAS